MWKFKETSSVGDAGDMLPDVPVSCPLKQFWSFRASSPPWCSAVWLLKPTAELFIVAVPTVADVLHLRVTEPWWSLHNTCFSIPLLCLKMMLTIQAGISQKELAFQDIRKFLRMRDYSGCLGHCEFPFGT